MDIIELQNVTKSFGPVTAVKELNLKVPAGRVYGFIGPNGSGKTTTIRMIMNIIYPDNGKILINGKSTKAPGTITLAIFRKERGLYKKMTVYDVLKFHVDLKNTPNIRKENAGGLKNWTFMTGLTRRWRP
jgi:ABC-2 type transport system ATP-binding protein